MGIVCCTSGVSVRTTDCHVEALDVPDDDDNAGVITSIVGTADRVSGREILSLKLWILTLRLPNLMAEQLLQKHTPKPAQLSLLSSGYLIKRNSKVHCHIGATYNIPYHTTFPRKADARSQPPTLSSRSRPFIVTPTTSSTWRCDAE